MKVWIVTNYGGGANYTPSVFKKEEDAVAWFEELACNNIQSMYEDEVNELIYDEAGNPITDDTKRIREIILGEDWYDVEINTREIVIGDPDESGNVIQLFETEIR